MSVMSLVKPASDLAKRHLGDICKVVARKSPDILTFGGLAVIGAGGVGIFRATRKLDMRMAAREEDVAIVKYEQDTENDKEARKALTQTYIRHAWYIASDYLPAIGLILGGAGMIVAGHNIQKQRIVMISTAYNGLMTSFNEYRERVREDQGIEKDYLYLTGAKEVEVVTETTTKTGKARKKTTKVLVPDENGETLYHRCFNANTSGLFNPKNHAFNLEQLRIAERLANQKFQAMGKHGAIFLSEVCDMIDLDYSDFPEAKIVGWMKDNGDNFISFGVVDETAMFPDYTPWDLHEIHMDGRPFTGNIWLEFNCDGVIIEKFLGTRA